MDVLKRIIPHLLLNLRFFPDVSLFHGKMGGVLFFYEYSRCTHEVAYENFASDLLDDFSHNIKVNTPINFENGLSGIGWGLQYLIQQRFIDADPDVILQDIDSEIINLAHKIANTYNSVKKPIFINKSIFELDYPENFYDVSYSNGVLEHFNDEQIIATLKQQLKVSKIVIFGIPTKYFNQNEAMYGDERYMDYGCWRELIFEAGLLSILELIIL